MVLMLGDNSNGVTDGPERKRGSPAPLSLESYVDDDAEPNNREKLSTSWHRTVDLSP